MYILKTDILSFCNSTKTINGIFEIFKEDFLNEFKKYKAKERPPIIKAIPYLYRIWFYTAFMADTALSPANFINLQLKKKYGDAYRLVPIVTPIYKNRVLKDFQFDYKIFSLDNHPVLEDLKMFLEHCTPDIGVDEGGLLLEEERDSLIPSLTFKEIFYASFLTNMAYELKLIKKMPSINIYRAMANRSNIEEFFKLSKLEQLKKIVEAVTTSASKGLSALFEFDKKSFSKDALIALFHNSQNLEEYSRNLFKKYGIDIDDMDLEDLYLNSLEGDNGLDVSEDTMMILALNIEFNFLMDATLLTPLGHYLQLIQPIYLQEIDFMFHFEQLIEAFNTNIPPIKLYFFMANSFDLTGLGKVLLLEGESPKDEFQELEEGKDFESLYEEIVSYCSGSIDSDFDFGDFNIPENDLNQLIKSFNDFFAPEKKSKKLSLPVESTAKETITDSKLAYSFKVKHLFQKRSWKSFELKGTQTLDDLANTIINNFDLDPGHLYSFFMNNKAWDPDYEITSPYSAESKEVTTKYKVHKLKLYEKQKFLFLYDFGDDIRFEVEFIEAQEADKSVIYPRLINSSKDYKE